MKAGWVRPYRIASPCLPVRWLSQWSRRRWCSQRRIRPRRSSGRSRAAPSSSACCSAIDYYRERTAPDTRRQGRARKSPRRSRKRSSRAGRTRDRGGREAAGRQGRPRRRRLPRQRPRRGPDRCLRPDARHQGRRPQSNGSSGFVRDDFFNWPEQIATMVETEKPAAIVVMLGSNDRQQMRIGDDREPTS